MEVITVKNLRKEFRLKVKQPGLKGSLQSLFRPCYKEVEAVAGVSFVVEKGEVLAFIGPNGAGKSTTIKMLTGILYPSSGVVEVLGYSPQRQRSRLAFKIGSVFGQKSQLWFHLPPLDSFQLLGAIYEIPSRLLSARIDELVDLLEIGDFLKAPVRKLSLGQRIRCELAASLLHEPEIIFLDEPTIGLDVVIKQKIRELITRLNLEKKVTIFFTSHDVGDIEKVCKRAIVIHHGRILLDEQVKKLKYQYLDKKIISVKYTEKVNPVLPHVRVLKQKDSSLKLEVDTRKTDLHSVMEKLITRGNFYDITVSDPPLEDIIARIYSTTRKEAEDAANEN
ncbi:MAG: ATP-binding cassette domain-containing protein [Spirochaetales bacterium]|nr:ATP-binding cassette domain-containing protein [Spirochaetales bacterium]